MNDIERLEAEVARLREALTTTQARLGEENWQNHRLREALERIADPGHDICGCHRRQIAREALAGGEQ